MEGALFFVGEKPQINGIIANRQRRIGVTDQAVSSPKGNLPGQVPEIPASDSLFFPLTSDFIHGRCTDRIGQFFLQQMNVPAFFNFVSFFINDAVADIQIIRQFFRCPIILRNLYLVFVEKQLAERLRQRLVQIRFIFHQKLNNFSGRRQFEANGFRKRLQ